MGDPYRAARRLERFLPSGYSLDSLRDPLILKGKYPPEIGDAELIATITYNHQTKKTKVIKK